MAAQLQTYKGLMAALGLVVLLSGCSAVVNWSYPRVTSFALDHPETTAIGAFVKEAADKHPDLSGFTVIQEGRDAFAARLALADMAEKTLDAQYYIWDADITGRILALTVVYACGYQGRARF